MCHTNVGNVNDNFWSGDKGVKPEVCNFTGKTNPENFLDWLTAF